MMVWGILVGAALFCGYLFNAMGPIIGTGMLVIIVIAFVLNVVYSHAQKNNNGRLLRRTNVGFWILIGLFSVLFLLGKIFPEISAKELLAIVSLAATSFVFVAIIKKIAPWISHRAEDRKQRKHQENVRLAAEKERRKKNEAQVRLLIAQKKFKEAYQFAKTNNLTTISEFKQMDANFRSQQKEAISFLKNSEYKKAIPVLTNLNKTPFDFGKEFTNDVKTADDLKEAVEYMQSFMK